MIVPWLAKIAITAYGSCETAAAEAGADDTAALRPRSLTPVLRDLRAGDIYGIIRVLVSNEYTRTDTRQSPPGVIGKIPR